MLLSYDALLSSEDQINTSLLSSVDSKSSFEYFEIMIVIFSIYMHVMQYTVWLR